MGMRLPEDQMPVPSHLDNFGLGFLAYFGMVGGLGDEFALRNRAAI